MNPKIKNTFACQQDWHQMQTVDGCKFCTSCQKQVIDFMAMDNHEIIQKLKQEKEVCARMSATQLAAINHQLNAAPTAAPKWMLMLGIGSVLGFAQPALAQAPTAPTAIHEAKATPLYKPIPKANPTKTIEGKVMGEDESPLPNVSVFLKDSDIKTITDENGFFALDLSEVQPITSDTIVFSYIGFITKELPLGSSSFREVEMLVDHEGLNKIVVVGGYCLGNKSFFQKIGDFFSSPFRKKHKH